MNYLVDLNRPKIKQAVIELGINPELLLIKRLENFEETDITLDIAQIRFSYYTRKQHELLKMITDKLNNDQPKTKPSTSNRPNTFLTQVSYQNKSDVLNDIKEKYQKKLLKSLKDIEKSHTNALEIEKKIEMSRENKQKVLSTKSARKNIMEKLKQKQMENLKIIQKQEALKIKKNNLLGSYTPKAQRNLSGDLSFKDYQMIVNDSEKDLSEKIKRFEEKMKKSEVLHELHVNKKKEAVLKLLERVPKKRERSLDNESEKIIRLISKNEAYKERREKLIKSSNAQRLRVKSQIEKKFNSAKNKYNLLQMQKSKDNEFKVKMAKSEIIIKKKQEDWLKKLEIRNEIHRLKEENIASELERMSNVM